MRLGFRVLLGFFLIVGCAAYFLLSIFVQEVKPGVRQGLEVALVDTANLLAEVAAQDLKAGGPLAQGRLAEAHRAYRTRALGARVWGKAKQRPEFRLYLTDAKGVVLYDSEGRAQGQDYSRWNDVLRTLNGEYGARATRLDPGDPSTSSMHVAAPVRVEGRLAGVLTVVAPTSGVVAYAKESERRVLRAGGILLGIALLVGLGITGWLTRSVGRLRRYARDVSEGRRTELPELGRGELAELGAALASMRDRLEGRQYVETYVQTLTHEMKSPLAAIRGAAELLQEDLPPEERARFATNIVEQEARLRLLLERMLGLTVVQHRQRLQDPGPVDLADLARTGLEAKAAAFRQRGLSVDARLATAPVQGEAFLLEQACSNLLDNAVAFAPVGSRLEVASGIEEGRAFLRVRDRGPGLPDFALPKVFDPFFSLPRPDTGLKSTGLGLSFVREVAELHGGTASLANRAEGGAEALLRLPLA